MVAHFLAERAAQCMKVLASFLALLEVRIMPRDATSKDIEIGMITRPGVVHNEGTNGKKY